MSVQLPDGWRIESLNKNHDRKSFDCGDAAVNSWFQHSARQSHDKNLSSTKVLVDSSGVIAGFYTLAQGQVHLDQLPHEIARRLPRQLLPVIVLGWLGVDERFGGKGLGDRLAAHALLQCHEASQRVGIIAVVIDCLTDSAKAFFRRFDFVEFPGHPMKLLLPKARLDAMMLDET